MEKLSLTFRLLRKIGLNYSEEDCRGMFQSGNAVFMPNWPYVWALANDPACEVAGKIEVDFSLRGVMLVPWAEFAAQLDFV